MLKYYIIEIYLYYLVFSWKRIICPKLKIIIASKISSNISSNISKYPFNAVTCINAKFHDYFQGVSCLEKYLLCDILIMQYQIMKVFSDRLYSTCPSNFKNFGNYFLYFLHKNRAQGYTGGHKRFAITVYCCFHCKLKVPRIV